MAELYGEIARVGRVFVGAEGHSIFTFSIDLKFGAAHQAFGGYALDTWDAKLDRRVGTAAGMDLLMALTRVLAVDDLHNAVGKYVYALREKPRDLIVGLRQLEPDGGKEFLISAWRAQWFPGEAAHG